MATEPRRFNLTLLPGRYAVSRLGAASAFPEWATRGAFFCVTKTPSELSLVCPQADVPAGIVSQPGWRILEVAGPLDFALTGVLAQLLAPLATAGVSIFSVSTHDTDYILVKDDRLAVATAALRTAGHQVHGAP